MSIKDSKINIEYKNTLCYAYEYKKTQLPITLNNKGLEL